MPKKKSYFEENRDKTLSGYSKVFDEITDIIERLIFAELATAITGLVVDEVGRFKFTIGNLTEARKIGIRVGGVFEVQKKPLARRIIDKVKRLFKFNLDYFGSYNEIEEPETLDEKVQRLVMARLGYNVKSGAIAPGSWLEMIFAGGPVAGQVGRDLTNAIASGMSREDFIRQFKQVFLKGGYAAQHFKTFSFDFFQVVDRQIKLLYAQELGLTHARYAGTVKNNTRDFCLKRIGLIYTLEEIKSWEKLEFRGKLKFGYDPFVHCGGFNCRHHLSYLDAAAVDLLGGKVDQYKPLPPKKKKRKK